MAVEPPAAEVLCQANQGMPRKANRLAHCALISAALGQARTVTARTCANRPREGCHLSTLADSFAFLLPYGWTPAQALAA